MVSSFSSNIIGKYTSLHVEGKRHRGFASQCEAINVLSKLVVVLLNWNVVVSLYCSGVLTFCCSGPLVLKINSGRRAPHIRIKG